LLNVTVPIESPNGQDNQMGGNGIESSRFTLWRQHANGEGLGQGTNESPHLVCGDQPVGKR
jgi:hypothetical protein